MADEDLDATISDALQVELKKGSFNEAGRVPAKRSSALVVESASEPAGRLPHSIAGGFTGLSEDLDRRARDWKNMVRLLEQQRPLLATAETERDGLSEALGRIVPEVQESGRALKTVLDATRSGDVSGDLAGLFTKHQAALDELESVAETLAANLLWLRSAWEQYAASIDQAQKMREEMKQGEH